MRFIYVIQNTENLKVYVGQTKNIKERWRKHRGKFARNCGHLYDAMAKYGREKFVFTVIEEVRDQDADDAESFWIVFFRSWDPRYGYNKTLGGQVTHKVTEETRRKISESVRKNRKPYRHTAETRNRLREVNIGRKASAATREKMSRSRKGWSPSDETRRKMGESKSGPTPWKRGNGNPNAKITEDVAREILKRASLGETWLDISKTLDVSYSIVRSVSKRLTWKHL